MAVFTGNAYSKEINRYTDTSNSYAIWLQYSQEDTGKLASRSAHDNLYMATSKKTELFRMKLGKTQTA